MTSTPSPPSHPDPEPFLAVLTADLRHMTATWDATRMGVLLAAGVRLPTYPAIGTMIRFRLSQAAYRSAALRPLAHWLKARSIRLSGAELHPAATIGPGFALVHSVGIVVGHEVRAGRELVLFHGVTLGNGGQRPGQPHLGDRVRIGAGAKVLGPGDGRGRHNDRGQLGHSR